MLGDFASLDVQNTYRGSDAYVDLEQRIALESQVIYELVSRDNSPYALT
ncbi:hypothetical protein [Piscirickettsia salmonis]|nr:hypothetical protein [Piscirickettsia salmonis]QNR80708.1 hypothetical protein ICC15_01295 [Piscirickettsia salmonis]